MAILENIQNSSVVRTYRQGWLAWLGAQKTAFDFAQDGVEKIMNSREQLVEELVQKGESVEELAQDNIKKVRSFVEPRITEVSEKVTTVSNKVFSRTAETSTDRVSELAGEVAKLAKSVSALSRKVNTTAKPAAKKAPAKRTVAKKVTVKATTTTAPKATVEKAVSETKAAA